MNPQDSTDGMAGALSSILKRVRFLNFSGGSDEEEAADHYSLHNTAHQRCPFSSKAAKSGNSRTNSPKKSLSPSKDFSHPSSSSNIFPEDSSPYSSIPTSIPKRLWPSQTSSSHSLTSSGSSSCFTSDSLPYTESFSSLRDDEEFSEPEEDYVEENEASLLEKEKISADNDDELPIYTLEEVSYHDTPHDCWMVLYDKVYNLTEFLLEHPGGEELLLEHAGRDATLAYRGVGHSRAATAMLRPLLIGRLPDRERIFTGWHLE